MLTIGNSSRMDDVGWAQCRALVHCGLPVSDVAKKLKWSRGAVYNAIRNNIAPSSRAKKCAKKDTATTRKISQRRALVAKLISRRRVVRGSKLVFARGRPRADGTPRASWTVTRAVQKLQFPSPSAVAREMSRAKKFHVSASTVKRDLRAIGLKAYARPRRPRLSAADKVQRLKFCKKMLRWPKRDLRLIIWTDEHWADSNDSGVRFQYLSKEHKSTVLPRETEQYPPKVLVWGAIGINFRHIVVVDLPENGERLTSDGLIQQCLASLKTKLGPARVREARWLQQDGARIHWTNAARDYVRNMMKMKIIEGWPAHSPDLNGIETIWSLLKKAVAERGPWGKEDIKRFVEEEFYKIPTAVINKICEGFAEKCAEVVRRNGAAT